MEVVVVTELAVAELAVTVVIVSEGAELATFVCVAVSGVVTVEPMLRLTNDAAAADCCS